MSVRALFVCIQREREEEFALSFGADVGLTMKYPLCIFCVCMTTILYYFVWLIRGKQMRV